MKWDPIRTLTLTYTPSDEFVTYDDRGGGQVYGAMEGRLELTGLSGNLRVTNTAMRSADGIFEPKLRGVLTTDEGVKLFVRMDGISSPDRVRGPVRPRPRFRLFRARERIRALREPERQKTGRTRKFRKQPPGDRLGLAFGAARRRGRRVMP